MLDFAVLETPVDEEVHVYDNLEIVGRSRVALPSKFSLVTPPVRDQFYSSWCVSFATSAMQYCDDVVKYGKVGDVLSPHFLHKHCKDLDRQPSALGTTLESAMKVITKYGICKESQLPFNKDDARLNKFGQITEDMKQEAKRHMAKSYARVSSIQKIKEAIYHENGVIAAFNIFKNFDTSKGYIPEPPKGDSGVSPIDRHCMFMCGWDDNHEAVIDGKKYKGFIKILDSYGQSSGSFGYRFLAYDLIDSYAYYSSDKLVKEMWCSYDPTNLVNPNYHTDRFKPSDSAITLKTKTIKMKLNSLDATVDNKAIKLLSKPVAVNGVTFVPLRQLSELFGCNVSWDPEFKKITIRDMERKIFIYLQIGNKIATGSMIKDGHTLLEAPFQDKESGTSMVPLRAISELLYYIVQFDGPTKEITIKG